MNAPMIGVVPMLQVGSDRQNPFEVLTLRDIFAMSALASLHAANGNLQGMPEAIAKTAYNIADAMLTEKYKVNQNTDQENKH